MTGILAKRPRVVGAKYSKNSCGTCRIRRVKCDEGKPSCNNCSSTGRSCDGYSSTIKPTRAFNNANDRTLLPSLLTSRGNSTPSLASAPSCLSFDTTPDDRQSFQYFTDHVARGLYRVSPTDQWITLSLQLALTQPAIFYAIAAVGTLATRRVGVSHDYMTLGLQPRFAAEDRQLAMQQYCKATRALQGYINEAIHRQVNTEPILLCCLMFILYEIYSGNGPTALTHLRLGKKAVEGVGSSVSAHRNVTGRRPMPMSVAATKETLSALRWLELASTDIDQGPSTFAHERWVWVGERMGLSASLPISITSAAEAKKILNRLIADSQRWRSKLIHLAEARIATTSIPHARPAVRQCVSDSFSRAIPLSATHHLLRARTRLISAHEAWLALILKLTPNLPPSASRSLLLMQIQYATSLYTLSTARSTHPSAADPFHSSFIHTLDLIDAYLPPYPQPHPTPSPVDQPLAPELWPYAPYSPVPSVADVIRMQRDPQRTFSLESGILPALSLICFECGHAGTRQRALGMLQRMDRREGLLWSGEWAVYAEAVIRLEEERARGRGWGREGERGEGMEGEEGVVIAEEARLLNVVVEYNGPQRVGVVCARFRHEGQRDLEILDYSGGGAPLLRLQLQNRFTLAV